MRIKKIKINYLEDNRIIDKDRLIICWELNQKQTKYKIYIIDNNKKIYVSKEEITEKNIHTIDKLQLKPNKTYKLIIKIWNDNEVVIEEKKFETGIFGNFKGKWISNGEKLKKEEDYYENNRNPVFRKKFIISERIEKADLFIVGLGYYNVYINGKKLGNAELNNDWTNYSREIYYDAYSIQNYIKNGENVIFVELGNGWYNPAPLTLFGKYNLRDVLTVGEPKMLSDLYLLNSEGEIQIISSDETWETAKGPYEFNNVYLGEILDFRHFKNSENYFDFKNTNWIKAVVADSPKGKLTGGIINKTEKTNEVRAKKIEKIGEEKTLIDFGETIEGFIDVTFIGEINQEVEVLYGESLNEDKSINFDSTLAGFVGKKMDEFQVPGGFKAPKIAIQRDRCILVEGENHYINKFTYHSFRYIEIRGIKKDKIKNPKAFYVHTKLQETGDFHCSDQWLNRLYQVAKRTKVNNIRTVFEDCARERFGYGGDIVGLASSQIFMFDSETMYEKVVKDFRNDMRSNYGIPETAPFMGIKTNGTGDGAGPLGWQLVYPFLVDKLYKYYGNISVIKEEYELLKKQSDYLESLGLKYLSNCCLGDWGSREAKTGGYKNSSPALNFTASCFYYYHIFLMEKFSHLLGKTDDSDKYKKLLLNLKNEIINVYLNEDGSFSDKSQTSYVFAVFFKFGNAKKLLEELINIIKLNNYEIKCGIFGMSMVYDLLVQNNYNEVIYKWLYSENGFKNMLKEEDTTLKEFFGDNKNGSENHAMFSSYVQWFFEGLGGINISENACGFDKLVIKPYFESHLDYVKVKYASIKGDIVVDWNKEKHKINLKIKIPYGLSTGLLALENKYKNSVKDLEIIFEDGKHVYFEIKDIGDLNLELKY